MDTGMGVGKGATDKNKGKQKPGKSSGTASPPASPAPPSDPAGELTDEQQSASAAINAFLAQYGLGELGQWAWQQYLNGANIDQIMLDLRGRPEYKARFPAMDELARQGRAISESQYVEYERSAAGLFQKYGLPKGFADEPSDFTAYLTGGVSLDELNQRIGDAAKAALASPEIRDQMVALGYAGDAQGALTAMWLDPSKALPLIEQQYTAAQISAQGKLTGFGALNRTEAERLAQLGVDENAASQGFQQIGQLGQVATERLAGETALSRQELLDAAFAGDVNAQMKIKQRAEGRVASFSGGGGFTQGKGRTGIGAQE